MHQPDGKLVWRLLSSLHCIVLLAIDLTAGPVLFAVDLLMFLTGEFPAIGGAVCADLLIDALFTVLGACHFSSRHLTALDAVGDSVLLIFAALSHFGLAVVRGGRIVLVLVNGLADVVLLTIDLLTFLGGEFSAVRGAVCVYFAIDVCFAGFEVLGFACRKLPGLYAVADALLLVGAAVIHRALFGRLGGRGLLRGGLSLLSEGCARESNGSHNKCKDVLFHGVSSWARQRSVRPVVGPNPGMEKEVAKRNWIDVGGHSLGGWNIWAACEFEVGQGAVQRHKIRT